MEFKYEIEKPLGTISTSKKNWTKELNIVSWNGAEAKYDIRDWSPEHARMAKGITLSEEEARELYKLLGAALSK